LYFFVFFLYLSLLCSTPLPGFQRNLPFPFYMSFPPAQQPIGIPNETIPLDQNMERSSSSTPPPPQT
jgi:hypothetical protein